MTPSDLRFARHVWYELDRITDLYAEAITGAEYGDRNSMLRKRLELLEVRLMRLINDMSLAMVERRKS